MALLEQEFISKSLNGSINIICYKIISLSFIITSLINHANDIRY